MKKSWFYIGYKNLINKPLNAFLSILLVVLGVCIISLLLQLNTQFDDQLKKNAKGVDMVIGAKGSPLQLILSAVYHIDAPTGNIDYETVKKVAKHPFVANAVPLAYGDSYKGYRILGATNKIFKQYSAEFKAGQEFDGEMQIVAGSNVSKQLNLNVGDSFMSSHGLKEQGEEHHHPFKIVGLLERTGTVADNLLFTSLASVWEVHEQEDAEQKQITAMLIKFKSPLGMMQIPAMVNAKKGMQAALPAVEVSRLNKLLGFSFATLNWIAIAIIITAALSIFVALFNVMDERKFEVALLRVIGFSRAKIFLMVITEALIIAVIGYVLGIALSRIGLLFVKGNMQASMQYDFSQALLPQEWGLLVGLIIVCVVAAVAPAIKALRVDISKTLTNA
jgi:putative ABC transport system permease protein